MTFRQRKVLCWIVTGLFALGSFCLTISLPSGGDHVRFGVMIAMYFVFSGMCWSNLATYPASTNQPANRAGTE